MFSPLGPRLGLELELLRWRRAGRRARLWWRDDDAAGPCAALDRLLEISAATAAPLTLAVIPAGDMEGLSHVLNGALLVNVTQHGVDHQNRRTGRAAGEFADDWSEARIADALASGWDRIAELPRAWRVFVPPWNDIHTALEGALRTCSFTAWSVEGGLGDEGGLPRVDVHLDLMRWRGGARFRGRRRFLSGLTRELARRRRAGRWDSPVGLLTHHLAHDAAAWDFLALFLRWSGARAELEWVALTDLLPAVSPKLAAA